MTIGLTRERVIESRGLLPAFPRVVDEILATLDDPDANLNLLVRHIGRDPVLAGRIYEQANAASCRVRGNARVDGLYAAVSLIGLARLRQTVIFSTLSNFLGGSMPPQFWEHGVSVGVCAQHLAPHAQQSADMGLIAGLLHDVGQLLMFRLDADLFRRALQAAGAPASRIETAERELFGVDHAQVGAWLAEGWGMPRDVCESIRWHHDPDKALAIPLVPVIHVAEVLSNALDPTGSGGTRVLDLSEKCCRQLGLTWDESAIALFGRIDAVSRFAAVLFKPVASPA